MRCVRAIRQPDGVPGSVKTEAVVLRSIRYGEADRIVHLYSATRGKIGAIAKGSRRPKSRFGGRLEPFFRLDMVLYEGRSDLLTVTGASTVEAVDLQDLIAFGNSFDVASAQAMGQLLALAQSVMTNVGVAELTRRLESLARGTARNPPSIAESSALAFQRAPSIAAAATLLSELREMPNVRVHRPAILYGVLKALRGATAGDVPLAEAARRVREENRLLGRPLPKRAVGSTLLLKGLEAEVVVVLNTEGMSAQHLYVAMTRGSMKLVVCSASPILG